MRQRVTHVPRRRKHKKTDRLTKAERRARLLKRQEQWIAQWIALAKTFIEMLLNSEIQELLGRDGHRWGDRSASVEVNACCNRCQRKYQGWFRRNGSYSRDLVTDGLVIELHVLSCVSD